MIVLYVQGFDSTHGKHVDVPDEGAVKVKTTRTARQYMNRRVSWMLLDIGLVSKHISLNITALMN